MGAIRKETQFLARRTATGIDELLDQRRRDLFTLAETPLIADYYRNVDFHLDDEAEVYRKELERYLRNFYERNGVYSQILYLDAQAREVCAVRPRGSPKTPTHASEDYFIKARAAGSGGWWTSSIEEGAGGTAVVHYSKPVYDERRELKGVLVLRYDLSQVRDMLANVEMGRRGRAYILTNDGRRLEGRPEQGDRRGMIVASNPLSRRAWTVYVEAPLQDFLAPLRSVRNAAILTALVGLLILVVIILVLIRSIIRPIAELVEAARLIGRGDLSHRTRVATSDELGVLSSSFNEMARNLELNRDMNQKLQQQLIQAEKLSAAGQLISSVAHELNNPLAAISGYIQNALHEVCPPQMREDLARVYKNVFRCRKIVDNLLFFVRQSGHERKRVDLNAAVDAALELLDYRLVKTEDVRVEKALAASPVDIVGDFQQVVQVLVNLISNACDAMHEVVRYPEGKRLQIRTANDGQRALIEIEDNGGGIAPELRETIFQPFFTTKEAGHGTGLGLPICRQIIREHGGEIDVESASGRGSVFRVALPVADETELDRLETSAEPLSYSAVPGKSVLVADDEEDIADLIARLLKEDGDEVHVALHGGEALKLLDERAYDLVISDIEMERAKGMELYARLSAQGRLPGTKLLFVTGDILNPKVLDFLSRTGAEYLVKPFDIDELRRTARRLLTGK